MDSRRRTRGETTLLNARDIAALNRARDVLRRLEDAAWRRSLDHHDPYAAVTAWDLGRLSEAASVADDAIFHVLSTARTDCALRMTDAQLFGTENGQAAKALEAAQDADVPPPPTRRPLPQAGRARSTARVRTS
jgi:hypothetical protein